MAKVSNKAVYIDDTVVKPDDFLLGTDINNFNRTKSYPIRNIAKTIGSLIELEQNNLVNTSDLVNDGEHGDSRFVEENEVENIVRELIVNVDSDKHYTHEQSSPSNHWVIQHDLNKKGSVTVTDSAGTVVEGQVIINDGNRIEILFNVPFWGFAHIN